MIRSLSTISICLSATLCWSACSSAPSSPDVPVQETPQGSQGSTPDGPIEVLEVWIDSDDAPAEIALLLGEAPRIERVWKEGEFYRAVVVDSKGPAASGEGDAVIVTLRPDGDTWTVAVAEAGPASTLWPAL